jgi:hypothetical protein
VTPRPPHPDPSDLEILAFAGGIFLVGCLTGFITGILVSLIP